MNKYLATVGVLLAAAAVPATAQDPGASPTYGDVSLSSGFTPDPFTVSVRSGGSIDASQAIGNHCQGFIADAPDFDLYYNAASFPLIISVAANADTTLVVNGPDGRWYCDDDGGDGLNPSIHLATPQSGLYNIWIGTYGSRELEPATLSISELYSQ